MFTHLGLYSTRRLNLLRISAAAQLGNFVDAWRKAYRSKQRFSASPRGTWCKPASGHSPSVRPSEAFEACAAAAPRKMGLDSWTRPQ